MCAGERNRTPDYCLEGSRFTTKPHPQKIFETKMFLGFQHFWMPKCNIFILKFPQTCYTFPYAIIY